MTFICVIKKININHTITVADEIFHQGDCKTTCCPWGLNFAVDCKHS